MRKNLHRSIITLALPKLPTWSRRVSEEHVIGVRFTASAPHPALRGSVPTNRSVLQNSRLARTLFMPYYVYIVRCRDNSLYTGVALNINNRIKQHNFGYRGAKSLRGKTPVILVYTESYNSKSEALKREREIKEWRKEKKEQLIKNVKV